MMRAAILALACALGLVLPSASARAEGTILIPAEITLEDATLTLGRLAVFEDVPADVASDLMDLSLGPAAAPAEVRTLGGAAIRARVETFAPGVRVQAPATILVRRAHQEVTPEWVRARVEQALEARDPWRGAEVQLGNWRLPSRFAVPANATGLRVHFDRAEDFVGRVVADLEFFDPRSPDRSLGRRSASVELSVRRPVVVAARDLRRNATPTRDALRVELRDPRRLPHDAFVDVDQVAGQPLRRDVTRGSVLSADFFDSPRLVRRGDPIEVTAGAGGLDVRLAARALEPGRLGEVIRAENPTSRKSFAVELTGPGTAVLADGRSSR